MIKDSKRIFWVNPKGDLTNEFKKIHYNKFLKFEDFDSYCQEAKKSEKLKYLSPLDGWLAMIIYPSPDVKNMAKSEGIPELIENIKGKNSYRISPGYEQEMAPLELDLDLCDHF